MYANRVSISTRRVELPDLLLTMSCRSTERDVVADARCLPERLCTVKFCEGCSRETSPSVKGSERATRNASS